MNLHNQIIELAAWGLDESPERDAAITASDLALLQQRAQKRIQFVSDWAPSCALLKDVPKAWSRLLSRHAERDDLRAEFAGLDWQIGVVDLRRLISFQRRLVLPVPAAAHDRDALDWPARVDIAFPQRRRSDFTHALHPAGLTLSSGNLDFTVRLKQSRRAAAPFKMEIHHGSPFLEVACYRERWFLRDGYHRAYRLLRRRVFELPAVVIHARSLQELGAQQPWFFPEQTLFSHRPPAVTDFLAEDIVLRWRRRARRKVVHVTITEHFEPMSYDQERS